MMTSLVIASVCEFGEDVIFLLAVFFTLSRCDRDFGVVFLFDSRPKGETHFGDLRRCGDSRSFERFIGF